MIFIRVQAVTGKLKELEEYRAGLHTDSFWHFPPLLNGTRSSGLLFECLDLQSYFDLWVINHFKLLLLPPSHILLTFHLFRHILTNDKFCVVVPNPQVAGLRTYITSFNLLPETERYFILKNCCKIPQFSWWSYMFFCWIYPPYLNGLSPKILSDIKPVRGAKKVVDRWV